MKKLPIAISVFAVMAVVMLNMKPTTANAIAKLSVELEEAKTMAHAQNNPSLNVAISNAEGFLMAVSNESVANDVNDMANALRYDLREAFDVDSVSDSGSGGASTSGSGGGGGDPGGGGNPDPDPVYNCNGVPKPCPCINGNGGDFWVSADGSTSCNPPQ